MRSAKKSACVLLVFGWFISNQLWAEPVTGATIVNNQEYTLRGKTGLISSFSLTFDRSAWLVIETRFSWWVGGNRESPAKSAFWI